eukprot:gene32360-33098_t
MTVATEMTDYYARRAQDYEAIYAKPERQTDLAALRLRLPALLVGRHVYEVACGTGYWTQFVAPAAASVFATDYNEEVLALAPAACVRIQTGKRSGRTSMDQATINRLMLRLAAKGLTVVRLKGGDPSVFGRVGEEVAFLRGHGIETRIVPGVTAACAAAAQFDI